MKNLQLHKNEKNRKNGKNKKKNLKGGMRQKDTSISSWEAVVKMIQKPGRSTFKAISLTSNVGFIFILSIPADQESEFQAWNSETRRYEDVLSLVFKLCIIRANSHDKRLADLQLPNRADGTPQQPIMKSTESLNNLFREAYLQQDIFVQTFSPNFSPICLAVSDFAYLDHEYATRVLQGIIRVTSASSDPITTTTLEYLIARLNERPPSERGAITRKLGLITMQLADRDKYYTLNDIKRFERGAAMVPGFHPGILEYDMQYSLACIFIAATKCRTFLWDGHTSNFLGNISRPHSFVIDLGRAVRAKYPDELEALKTDDELADVYGRIKQRVEPSLTITPSNKPLPKNYFLEDLTIIRQYSFTDLYGSNLQRNIICLTNILLFLSLFDCAKNYTFTGGRSTRPQCSGFLNFLFDTTAFSEISWTEIPPQGRPKLFGYFYFPPIEPGQTAPNMREPYYNATMRLLHVSKMIEEIVTDRQSDVRTGRSRNIASAAALRSAISEGRLFSITEPIEQYAGLTKAQIDALLHIQGLPRQRENGVSTIVPVVSHTNLIQQSIAASGTGRLSLVPSVSPAAAVSDAAAAAAADAAAASLRPEVQVSLFQPTSITIPTLVEAEQRAQEVDRLYDAQEREIIAAAEQLDTLHRGEPGLDVMATDEVEGEVEGEGEGVVEMGKERGGRLHIKSRNVRKAKMKKRSCRQKVITCFGTGSKRTKKINFFKTKKRRRY